MAANLNRRKARTRERARWRVKWYGWRPADHAALDLIRIEPHAIYTRGVNSLRAMLSVDEAAVALATYRTALYRMIRAGTVKTKKRHGKLVIAFREVVRLKRGG